jgi:hypothetical protein
MDRKQVVVYDLLSGKTQTIIPRLLVPDVQVLPPLFEWTRSGIIVRQMRLTRNDEALGAFMLYSPEGKLLSKIEAPYPDQQPLESIVVLDGDRDLMMLRYERDTFFFDLLTGERLENVTGTLVRVSASNPSESLQVAPQMIYEDGLQVGQLYAPDGEQVLAYQGVYSFFSPSGHGLIYLWSSKTLEGWSESGGKFTIELPKYPQYLIWGKSAWMLKRGGNLLVKGSYCERGKLSPRLVKYNKGFVLPGDANNLRSAPSVNAAKIGAIPGGETFIVYDGPVCSGGMAWWQVDYDGTVGWTVEGADDEYWLSPGCPDGPCVYEPG